MSSTKRIRSSFNTFCENTSIHGLRYIGEKEASHGSHMVWSVITVIAFCASGYFIYESVSEWSTNPVLISVETTEYPIEKIPFPTVTVCRKNNDLNRIQFITRILDNIKFPCYEDVPTESCTGLSVFLKGLELLLRSYTDKLYQTYFPTKGYEDHHQEYFYETRKGRTTGREFINLVVKYAKDKDRNVFKEDMFRLFQELGPMPGKFADPLKNYLVPRLRFLLGNYSQTSSDTQDPNCGDDLNCQNIVFEAATFIDMLDYVFLKPFPQLGTFLSYFARHLFREYDFNTEFDSLETATHLFLANLLKEYYGGKETQGVSLYDLYAWGSFEKDGANFFRPSFSLLSSSCSDSVYWEKFYDITDSSSISQPYNEHYTNCCHIFTKPLIHDQLQNFVELMKQSMVANVKIKNINADNPSMKNSVFIEKYLSQVEFVKAFNLTLSQGFQNHLGMLFYCGMIADIFKETKHKDCQLFKPVPTNFGICQSFNSLAVGDIYLPNPTTNVWSTVFDQEYGEFNLTYPKGYGSCKGLYIMLNGFETHGFWRKNRDFVISITNEDNYYEIVRHSYTLEPGNLYTYKVMASQITTTKKFEAMSVADRKCLLQSETDGIKYMSGFSRSGCEFECALDRATQTCSCIPWTMPRANHDDLPFCDMLGNMCFLGAMKQSTSFDNCNCHSRCDSTTLSVFESSRPFDVADYCDNLSGLIFEFANFTFYKHRLWFRINNIDNLISKYESYTDACNYLLKNHVVIIKVEMATKSLIRSVRDKRFPFETQLASLGGTLGLFAGMSLISCIEIFVWIFKAIQTIFLAQL